MGQGWFFTDAAPAGPAVDSTNVAEPPMVTAAAVDPEEMEPATRPAPPKFAELAEEPAYTPPPKEYYPALNSDVRDPAAPDGFRGQPDARLFPLTEEEEAQPDLEMPTFLRRLQL